MLIYLMCILIFILVIISIYIFRKMLYYKNELEAEKDMFLYTKNKISMIEYHYRNFKEGQNAYTTLRRISDTLQDYYR